MVGILQEDISSYHKIWYSEEDHASDESIYVEAEEAEIYDVYDVSEAERESTYDKASERLLLQEENIAECIKKSDEY